MGSGSGGSLRADGPTLCSSGCQQTEFLSALLHVVSHGTHRGSRPASQCHSLEHISHSTPAAPTPTLGVPHGAVSRYCAWHASQCVELRRELLFARVRHPAALQCWNWKLALCSSVPARPSRLLLTRGSNKLNGLCVSCELLLLPSTHCTTLFPESISLHSLLSSRLHRLACLQHLSPPDSFLAPALRAHRPL